MSRLSPVVEAYLDHLRVERRLSSHTLESYARDLAALAAFAAGAGRAVGSLDRPALEAFVREQRSRGLSPRSVARSVAAIRGFFRFLVLDRRLDGSPADDLRPPRAWPALPTFLSIEEVDRLIAQPDVSTTLGARDRAMIELLYATGLRVSELVGVRLADLHLDAGPDGLDVVDALRRTWGRIVPAALVTADRDPTLRVRARARQVELLHKPVKPASLRALLRVRVPAAGRISA